MIRWLENDIREFARLLEADCESEYHYCVGCARLARALNLLAEGHTPQDAFKSTFNKDISWLKKVDG